jgi:group I intron endonuclease
MFDNHKNIAGIYKLTNTINGKIYIGKSKNLFYRIQDHKYARSKCVIDKAIRHYGWNNFSVEILEEFVNIEKYELLALETAYIEFFQSLIGQNGYNVCLSGNDRTGFPHSEKTKQKISKTKTGTMKGKRNPFYGKTHTQETLKKMSEDGKKRGADWNKIKVKQIDENSGKVIKVWDSAKEACLALNGKISSAITNVVLKKKWRKSAFGFFWEYA